MFTHRPGQIDPLARGGGAFGGVARDQADRPSFGGASAPGGGADKSGRPTACVIGAGFGGLAAAMRLGAKGYHVVLLDKLDTPGGRGSAIHQGGYRFDLGPTIVTVPEVFQSLWAACGRRFEDDVDLRALDPFYKIRFDDGSHFTAGGDVDALLEEAARLSPQDRPGAERLLKGAETRYKVAFNGLGRRPMHALWETIKVLPSFAWLRADRSIYRHAAAHVRDERLRMAFSFHPLFIGGDPFAVTSMYALVSHLEGAYGVHYAMGGTVAIAEAMVKVIRAQGGEVRLGVEVDEILAEDGRAAGVRLGDGQVIPAALVVSNADAGHTYDRLLRKRTKRRWTSAKLRRYRWSMGLFVWYFGTKGTAGRWPETGHHTIQVGPRYRGLVKDIFRRGALADDMSLYVHRPSVTDPSVAPEGDDAFYVLSPVPHLGHANAVDWEKETEVYRRKVLARLEETVLPGLGETITESYTLTPPDFEKRYLSPYGSGFSIEPRILQSAWFRPHNKSEELDGLYLVGAGTHPGAGLPGVICSAEVIDQLIPEARAHADAAVQARLADAETLPAELSAAGVKHG
ncbi:MAG: phytoene desaturase [Pseudomonadota bacterium]